MKGKKLLLISATVLTLFTTACQSLNRTQKGAAIGTAGGGAIGAVIGRAAGNAALGAIIGATVGGVTGAVIGKKMDKQAEEIKREVAGVKVERVGEGIVLEFNSKILFGFDRADLSASAKKNLDDLARVLNKYPDTDMEIQGHTDNKGQNTYNNMLSQKRAGEVAAYLKGKGVTAGRINTKGLGESTPKYSNNTEEGRTENRRVEFLISANEKMKEDARKEAEKKN